MRDGRDVSHFHSLEKGNHFGARSSGTSRRPEVSPPQLELFSKAPVQILMLGADCVNCRDQFLSSIRLHYVTACTDTKSLPDGGKLIVLGQEKDFCFGSNSLYLAGGFESIHSGHRNIQDDNVGLKLPGMNDRVGTIGDIADNRKVRFGAKECADCFSCDRMVVNDDDVCALTHRPPRYHRS